ncbi:MULTISPECIES: sigma-54-dependent transcriptional regulator [unclassified Sphingomonas]|uniref:sigma-54-dependent transcriptional regulator n=1 Tax=unclassified Sphingomonas TaxID=196159 RepID=UPI000AA0F5DC|nr:MULTISPECIES: response regulator [unclassified Sphingomonas]
MPANERTSSDLPASDRPCPDALSENGQEAGASSGLTVLLIDDNASVAESIALAVRLSGHRIDAAATPEEALSRLAAGRYDVVLLDMNYAAGRTDGAEGLALLARILSDDPGTAVVVITAHSGVRIAVEAMRAGARDFIMKPWRNADLLARIATAARARTPVAVVPQPMATEPARLLGDSAAMAALRDLIRRIGPTRAGVVVTGPAGSGRALTAAALHAASADAGTAMPVIDLRDDAAWGRLVDTSTILLRHPDRLGEVAQARLLAHLPATTRCIAIADSANGILPALARRIATVEIAVPPLAARGDDALLLARHFLRIAAARHGRPVPTLTPAAEARILRGPWPDEVRGLAAAIERAVLLGDGGTIDTALLAPETAAMVAADAPARFDLDENERAVIEAALREHRHNVSHAAAALGLSRGALYRRMARHGL